MNNLTYLNLNNWKRNLNEHFFFKFMDLLLCVSMSEEFLEFDFTLYQMPLKNL